MLAITVLLDSFAVLDTVKTSFKMLLMLESLAFTADDGGTALSETAVIALILPCRVGQGLFWW